MKVKNALEILKKEYAIRIANNRCEMLRLVNERYWDYEQIMDCLKLEIAIEKWYTNELNELVKSIIL